MVCRAAAHPCAGTTGEVRRYLSQGDYLALVSETAVKTRELPDAEALATQKS
ncbi:hypothetical protein KCP74_20200 [Salmonella enterica subsp. enterica]|nr:hypothetical protein KCP74_20200 [Salmonella enterica subsp. enterica]